MTPHPFLESANLCSQNLNSWNDEDLWRLMSDCNDRHLALLTGTWLSLARSSDNSDTIRVAKLLAVAYAKRFDDKSIMSYLEERWK